jgi:hypothetical protein
MGAPAGINTDRPLFKVLILNGFVRALPVQLSHINY